MGATLGTEALGQVRDLVRRMLGKHNNEAAHRGPGPQPRVPMWAEFKMTSGPTSGLYTGDIVIVNEAGVETVIATAQEGKAAGHLLDDLVLNSRYPARVSVKANGDIVWNIISVPAVAFFEPASGPDAQGLYTGNVLVVDYSGAQRVLAFNVKGRPVG